MIASIDQNGVRHRSTAPANEPAQAPCAAQVSPVHEFGQQANGSRIRSFHVDDMEVQVHADRDHDLAGKDLFRRYAVVITEHGTDEHGAYWIAAPAPEAR